jgi:hypothetical protein
MHILFDTAVGKVFEWLLIAGGGVVMGLFQYRERPWVKAVLTGLATSVLLYAFFLGVSVSTAVSDYRQSLQPKVTAANIEGKIRDWVYAFGGKVSKADRPGAGDAFFAMDVVPEDSLISIMVARPRDYPHYVSIAASLELSSEHKRLLDKLDERERKRLIEEVRVELSRGRVSYSIELPLKRITVSRMIPITDDLSEGRFMDYLFEIQHDMTLVADTIILGLEDASHEN